jgi:4a-hydroxytetrahydrobiopterin dehydratase
MMVQPISPEVAYRALDGHSAWVVERHRLYRDFRLGSFTEAISLVNRLAEVAERLGHHPNILVHEWCFVRVELYSHLEDALSDRDVELALAIDSMLDQGSQAAQRD